MKKRIRNGIIAICVAAAAVTAFSIPYAKNAAAGEEEDAIRSITETVQKTALQCYVIEGVYPQGLEYLEENYGLTVNTKDYLVMYDSFAENLPPDIRVVKRNS